MVPERVWESKAWASTQQGMTGRAPRFAAEGEAVKYVRPGVGSHRDGSSSAQRTQMEVRIMTAIDDRTGHGGWAVSEVR
jgi:hypothetical protein